MKITLIHGKNTEKSRQRYLNIISTLKKKDWEIVKLNLDDKVRFIDKVSTSNSLFTDKTLFVVDKFNKIPVTQIEKLNSLETDSNILLWQSGNASSLNIKKLPKDTNIEKFDIPVLLFKFLDSVYPKNSKNSLTIFHDLLKSEPVELIFVMLGSLFKDLYWAQVSPKTLPYQNWRITKLNSQAKKFGKLKLKKIIKKLAKLDINSKTSQIDLVASLDLFLVGELQ